MDGTLSSLSKGGLIVEATAGNVTHVFSCGK
jgi:hypothetical protein